MIDDESLLARVGEAFAAIDPVPAAVRDAALAAYALRWHGAVLAELSADSGRRLPAGVRAPSEPRLLVFTGPDVVVEIEVTGEGTDLEIAGRLAPATAADITVRHGRGEVATWSDQTGHFIASEVPAGPVSLVFTLADASSVVTSWVRL
jgi:hypothetical protein